MHVEDRQRHAPGQHYLIRLRAPDDYTAQRSYSVASDDDDPLVEFLVERLPGGEVSEFLADVAEVGDVLELRGPIGRWFVWDTRTPALCLVGGTGVVPAVAMIRTARRLGRPTSSRWWRSGAPPSMLPYVEELRHAGATVAFTRHEDGQPPGRGADARGAPPAARSGPARLRLRLTAVRRVRRAAPARLRRRPHGDPRRAVRRHRLSRRRSAPRCVPVGYLSESAPCSFRLAMRQVAGLTVRSRPTSVQQLVDAVLVVSNALSALAAASRDHPNDARRGVSVMPEQTHRRELWPSTVLDVSRRARLPRPGRSND